MTNQKLSEQLADIQKAIRSFLTPLMGEEPPLKIGTPMPADVHDAQADATPLLGIHSQEVGYTIVVDPDWLPLIARLKTGDETVAGDPGYESVVTDLASQVQQVIREWFVNDGTTAPTNAGFQINPPDSPLPDACFSSNDVRVPFSLEWEGKLLSGFIIMPAPEEEAVPASDDMDEFDPTPSVSSEGESDGSVRISAAAFPELGGERDGDQLGGDLGLLAEVELEVSVELGHRRMPLADILRLTSGSVIELEKMVGEPLLIYANNRLIAEGEAVVIDDQFGVRITGLASRLASRSA